MLKKINITNFLTKFCIYFIAFFINFSVRWVSRNFGEVSFDQILFHIQLGVSNLSESDPALIVDFHQRAIYIPAALALGFALIHSFYLGIFNFFKWLYTLLQAAAKKAHLSSALSPKFLHLHLLIFAFLFASFKFSIPTFIGDQVFRPKQDFYSVNYVSPNTVELIGNNQKNLILIYVESLENTYSRSDLFKSNLIRRLQPNYLGGISFDKQRQLPGTGWTIAGIIATQCGIPLKSSLGGEGVNAKPDNKVFTRSATFLPSAVCLGDILKEKGYINIYMQGASLGFAGKSTFFNSHGYDEIYGKEEFLQLDNKIPLSTWGVYDDDLLKFAKKRIDELESKPNQPYNLTLLTLDTHQPVGHLSRTCAQRGVKKFRGIVRCTAELVSELTEYIKEKGYLENTSVIIIGDHLAMTNPEFDKIKAIKDRTVFNNYITNNSSLTKNRDEFLPFDHFPTILDSIGINVSGGKLGLGVSGFGPRGRIEKSSQDRFNRMQKNILRYSETYQKFWEKPEIK